MTRASLTVTALYACFLHCTALEMYPRKITVGFIGPRDRIPFAEIVLKQAEKQLKIDGYLPNNLRIEYKFKPGCDVELDVLKIAKDLFELDNADVLIGPECTVGMKIAALVAAVFDRPIFGYGSLAAEFSNKSTYPTLVRTSKSMGSLGSAMKALLNYFDWDSVAVIRTACDECRIGLSGILGEIMNKSANIDIKAQMDIDRPDEMDKKLITAKSVARIIIVCFGWEPSSANEFLLKARDNQMNKADYVYVIPYYLKFTTDQLWPWQDTRVNASTRQALLEMYKNVLVIQATSDNVNVTSNFVNYMTKTNGDFNYTSAKQISMDSMLPIIFDTMYMYGMVINRLVKQGGNISSGTEIRQECKYMEFTGLSGKIMINQNSDRVDEYDVYSMNGTEFTPLIKIPANVRNYTVDRVPIPLRAETFSTPDGLHPLDTPKCGFTMDNCLKEFVTVILIVAASIFGAILLLIMVFAYYRKMVYEKSLIKMSWKMNLSDVQLLNNQSKHTSASLWDKQCLKADSKSVINVTQLPEFDKFNNFACVRGVPAFAKCYRRKKMPILRREHLVLLKRIKELQHDNLNTFLGAVMDDGPLVIACWKYAAKGSLLDVVMNQDINLDDMFVASILKDITLGLEFLHKSALNYHGSLTVMNCVVDSRWTVRLTDFAWGKFQEQLKESEVLFFEELLRPQHLYHCAPEVLRKTIMINSQNYYAAMRAADVYSYAIVLYYVIYRSEPLYDDQLTPEEIIHRIKKTGIDPFRPHAPETSTANPKLISLMHQCWHEDPNFRPTMTEVKTSLESIFGESMRRSLLDHMMSRLEKYATNLEKVVEERTQQLEAERRRADQLLYQMLPRSVADLLKSGLTVEPESYESVTIYFSDIVGFTSLSSDSTPMEIVTMLNRLYSDFDETIILYDVYKVETIGDAYMVVSGLPHRNGQKHATEICDMALSILNVVNNFEIPHRPDRRMKIRIGVHSGPVAAGVVGLTMPRFCLFGDTVNTASRMESNGEPSKIHISETTESYLRQHSEYVTQLRGQISLKGKGMVTSYWLLQRQML